MFYVRFTSPTTGAMHRLFEIRQSKRTSLSGCRSVKACTSATDFFCSGLRTYFSGGEERNATCCVQDGYSCWYTPTCSLLPSTEPSSSKPGPLASQESVRQQSFARLQSGDIFSDHDSGSARVRGNALIESDCFVGCGKRSAGTPFLLPIGVPALRLSHPTCCPILKQCAAVCRGSA